MKPVYRENNIEKLKNIIDNVVGTKRDDAEIFNILNEIEHSVKEKNDKNENKILLILSTCLVIFLSITLSIITSTIWPLLFFILSIGLYLYYRIHEKWLIITSLEKKKELDSSIWSTKAEYLLSGVNLKIKRKKMLTLYLSFMFSSSVMLTHYLFIDSSFLLNITLLLVALIVSYFFWKSFYKEDIIAFSESKEKLTNLYRKAILDYPRSSQEE